MDDDIAIIGGGLSGLALADRLTREGLDLRLFEARDRLGGRILSEPASTPDREGGRTVFGAAFDLGPAWLWSHNRRMLRAAERFGLPIFEQYAQGRLAFQDEAGAVRRDLEFAPMAGSLRLAGGAAALTSAFAEAVPPDRLHVRRVLRRVQRAPGGVALTLDGPAGTVSVRVRRVAFALPPRLLAAHVAFEPDLPSALQRALTAAPTWMAGQAKLVAVYPTPFWRDAGLSGDAISRRGPLAEIHDASPADGSVGALFGFVGAPADARRGRAAGVRQAALAQLGALFGPQANAPRDVLYKDWADDPATATAADRAALAEHPQYGATAAFQGAWEGRLFFAGAEAATQDGGYMEGALEAAEACAAHLVGNGAAPA
ncbi:MAG: FAD-dependent oxidoreductase [Alphaproteobacteria bacterium]|nr:FAD-dependent oxidoreductase [Alphaproteobacteria bacterium]